MVEDQNFHKVKKIIYVLILFFVFASKSYSQNFKLEKLVNLDSPWGSSFINSNEIIITEKSGKIKIVNIDYQSNTIKILGKGNKERIVILGKEAVGSIKNYLRVSKNSHNIYLYPSSHKVDSHLSESYVYKMVKYYLKKVTNNEKMSPHSLRHSFATHLLNKGADLMSVRELLGHEDLSSTQIYTHISKEKLKRIYKKTHPHGEN